MLGAKALLGCWAEPLSAFAGVHFHEGFREKDQGFFISEICPLVLRLVSESQWLGDTAQMGQKQVTEPNAWQKD